MATAPTRDIGSIDLRDVIGQQWIDVNEIVPDLAWPNSVPMYARMRHDPKLTAILRAYMLPIQRATWAVDPAGCRDEVVQVVADDLGLPILGADEAPGGARRRGVNWSEHLRLALLSLVYGFMPFERRYEIRGGRARLVNLGERMPWTITSIPLNRDGTLQSVVQDLAGATPIPANRLLWYANEREGAAWTGRSLLRPAYGPWLLKHELWRVNATSIRRFGMGIPSVEAPAGASPAQVAEAQRLASAMRAGDTAGVGLPPGFKLAITGMTGSAPDAMAMIQYLDQQMSTFALAGFLDLGQTATGSRALGESFIDLFLLSLQAVADDLAEVATSGQPGMTGAVTDIVDLNWGEDEPAPNIRCTDVGERHDLSAEAINGMIESGAITPDPDLEAYLRKAHRLPPRAQEDAASGRSYEYDLDFGVLTVDERRAQIGLPPLPNGEGNRLAEPSSVRLQAAQQPAPAPAPAQAARRRRQRKTAAEVRAAGDPAAGHRQLTTVEAASGVDPDAIAEQHTDAIEELLTAWGVAQTAQIAALIEQVTAAVEAGDTAALAELAADTGPAAEVLAAAMVAMAAAGAAQIVAEAAAQGVTVTAPPADEDAITEVAATVAALMAAATATAVGREALRVLTPGRTGEQVATLVLEHMESLTDAWPREQLGGALWAGQASGRFAALDAAPTATYSASEILDANTCGPCLEIDGHEFESLEASVEAYPVGAYYLCEGGLRCRGIVIAVWSDE